MAITETKYFPSANGASLSGGTGANYFRLEVKHTYDPVANTSELAVTAQVKCTTNIAPSGLYFTEGKVTVGGVQVLDLVPVGSSRYIKPLYSNMNTWVNVGLNGSVYTGRMTVPASSHTTAGAFSVAIAFTKVRVFVDSSSLNAAADASSGTLSFTPSREFSISVSASNCSVSVTKGGAAVGSTVNYGDVLTISASPNTGYGTPSITVIGATKSGSTYTVTGPVTVTATATKKAYTLTIDQGPNSTIRVARNGSVLSDGATIYHFDQLVITMAANSGHHLTLSTINDTPSSGGSYTVSSNVKVKTVAAPNDHTLHLTQGAHTTLTVTLDGSPLSNNANVQTGDHLVVSATADTGYNTPTVTVTGATKSDNEYVVGDSDVNVASSTTPQAFTLTITQGENSTVTVTKNGSPVASGGTIYYDDELIISAVPDSGYELSTFTVNGGPFISGGVLVVSGNVVVVTVAEELVGAYLKLANEVARYTAYIKKAADEIARYIPYIQTTNGWVKY